MIELIRAAGFGARLRRRKRQHHAARHALAKEDWAMLSTYVINRSFCERPGRYHFIYAQDAARAGFRVIPRHMLIREFIVYFARAA